MDAIGAGVGRRLGVRELVDLRAGETLVGARSGELRDGRVAAERLRDDGAIARSCCSRATPATPARENSGAI